MLLPQTPLALAALLTAWASMPSAAAAAAAKLPPYAPRPSAAAAAGISFSTKTASTMTTTTTTATLPCTASSTSGAFYDLRADMAVRLADGAKPKFGVPVADYHARGHDYGANFTINICAPVVEPVAGVVGVDRALWGNVSAYYERDGEVFSLGQASSALTARGRELVLQYTGGSPCPEPSDSGLASLASLASLSSSSSSPADGANWHRRHQPQPRGQLAHDGAAYRPPDHDDDHAAAVAAAAAAAAAPIRRKSATFAFLCDRDPLDNVGAVVSFVGSTPDQCAYFFKIRSQHACATAEPHKPGSVGPGGVFAIILGVALLVYFIGGVVYQRTVAHARGWRQLPNHTLWLGIWNFVRDFVIIFASAGARCLPRRRGYQTVSGSPSGHGRDDENRLIDQLDEEWED